MCEPTLPGIVLFIKEGTAYLSLSALRETEKERDMKGPVATFVRG